MSSRDVVRDVRNLNDLLREFLLGPERYEMSLASTLSPSDLTAAVRDLNEMYHTNAFTTELLEEFLQLKKITKQEFQRMKSEGRKQALQQILPTFLRGKWNQLSLKHQLMLNELIATNVPHQLSAFVLQRLKHAQRVEDVQEVLTLVDEEQQQSHTTFQKFCDSMQYLAAIAPTLYEEFLMAIQQTYDYSTEDIEEIIDACMLSEDNKYLEPHYIPSYPAAFFIEQHEKDIGDKYATTSDGVQGKVASYAYEYQTKNRAKTKDGNFILQSNIPYCSTLRTKYKTTCDLTLPAMDYSIIKADNVCSTTRAKLKAANKPDEEIYEKIATLKQQMNDCHKLRTLHSSYCIDPPHSNLAHANTEKHYDIGAKDCNQVFNKLDAARKASEMFKSFTQLNLSPPPQVAPEIVAEVVPEVVAEPEETEAVEETEETKEVEETGTPSVVSKKKKKKKKKTQAPIADDKEQSVQQRLYERNVQLEYNFEDASPNYEFKRKQVLAWTPSKQFALSIDFRKIRLQDKLYPQEKAYGLMFHYVYGVTVYNVITKTSHHVMQCDFRLVKLPKTDTFQSDVFVLNFVFSDIRAAILPHKHFLKWVMLHMIFTISLWVYSEEIIKKGFATPSIFLYTAVPDSSLNMDFSFGSDDIASRYAPAFVEQLNSIMKRFTEFNDSLQTTSINIRDALLKTQTWNKILSTSSATSSSATTSTSDKRLQIMQSTASDVLATVQHIHQYLEAYQFPLEDIPFANQQLLEYQFNTSVFKRPNTFFALSHKLQRDLPQSREDLPAINKMPTMADIIAELEQKVRAMNRRS